MFTSMGWLSASPLPVPTAQSQVDADLVTPGLWGFATLFLSAVAVFFLARSMARRVQRVEYRARLLATTEEQPGGNAPDGEAVAASEQVRDEGATSWDEPVPAPSADTPSFPAGRGDQGGDEPEGLAR